MKLYTTPPSILTLVTWVPQNRQGKLHPSLPFLLWISDPQSSGLSSLKAALNLEGVAGAGRLRRRAPPAGYGGLLL